MFSNGEVGSTLRQARKEAGVSLTAMARELYVSKSHLSNIEAGRRPATVDIVRGYEKQLGPIGDDMLRRRDITHPRVMTADRPTLTELARSIDNGDPGVLATAPSSRTVDFFLAAKLTEPGIEHMRVWVRTGHTSTLRANALAVLAKLNKAQDTALIIDVLESDKKVKFLSLVSEVSKLTQWDWEISKQVVREPATAPDARKLAKALTKEALLDNDTESRWCGAYLLKELVPVLGK
ncbi:helix-turn-helix domain-containing protein [Saccharopolyspora sp. ASAGF58]|uniref:helix-turn-helix domain-containing protein n=1 Tax=Saccharopolyspora sp. ASAGF58 TaxID=2719023 RepID=UPI0014401CA1|nr:helix-turn-helix transcriptional regulator [Saccharopolyspora sp. ASAGF58]QIZ35102.1 helix-turn-helix transcriptional regulator [Saccharopolyspora sp. ASAGF58]